MTHPSSSSSRPFAEAMDALIGDAAGPAGPCTKTLRFRIAEDATHALLDHNHRILQSSAYYDALMLAMPGWQRVSMLDLTKKAKDPFAWFLFTHPEHGWWASFRAYTPCLSHPFVGSYIQTHLVTPADLTAGITEDEFLDEVFALAETATAAQEQGTLDRVHAEWVLAHFPHSDRADAYRLLLGLDAS